MSWRSSNPDARPISEYLYFYHSFRKGNRFLYYCRDCIRNFDTQERIEKCPKCRHTSLIELPKDNRLERRRGAKKYGKENFAQDLVKTRKEIVAMLGTLQHALWRARIAAYYFFTPIPEELR